MSRYEIRPLELARLRRVPLAGRPGKVRVSDFATPVAKGTGAAAWFDSLPRLLAAGSLRAVVEALEAARERRRSIIWGLGGHVIKCGLAPVLADLARRGLATAFALNGAAAIHDLEIALCGSTSEDVETVLPDGSFGAAEETGVEFNRALSEAARDSVGAGEALSRIAHERGRAGLLESSLLASAWEARIPVTVHIAVGTDTPHMHPATDPAALGTATHHDFRLLAALVAGLDQGGVYLNVGSAVVLPEVFLKAVTAVRNLGHRLAEFTTVNLDFLQHYRPRVNVVERPHIQAGGRGLALTGHHEIMIPLIQAILADRDR